MSSSAPRLSDYVFGPPSRPKNISAKLPNGFENLHISIVCDLLWRRNNVNAKSPTQLIEQTLFPSLQLLWIVLQLGPDVLINQQQLPQLQVVTRQKITFLDSAKCPVA